MSLNRRALSRIFPFALFIGFLALDPLFAAMLPAALAPWLYALRSAAVALALALLWRRYGELASLQGCTPARLLAAVVLGLAVCLLWLALDAPWMRLPFGVEGGFDPRRPDGGLDLLLVAFRLGGAALVVPVMEELFWRSFLARWIDRPDFLAHDPARIGNKALLLSSLLFALEHHQWLAGLVAGLAYGGLYRASRNLWLPILAHGVTNLALGLWVIRTESWQNW